MSSNYSEDVITNEQADPEEMFLMTRYIPFRVSKAIAEPNSTFMERLIEHLEGVVIYLDIKGFTSIVNGYMQSGRDVAELRNTVSDYYSVIIETVREFGGSVFQFAGDSILICFDRFPNETNDDTFRRALGAMVLVLELSDNYNAVSQKYVNFSLHPKIGMGQGDFFQVMVGNRGSYITPVLAGTAVVQAVKMEEMCTRQEIVLSPSAYQSACNIGLGANFAEVGGFYHLINVPEGFSNSVERPDWVDQYEWFEHPEFYSRAFSFVNPIIWNQIKNNVEGFDGDYREVTCCMVRFDGVFPEAITEDSIADGYYRMNEIYEIMHALALRFGVYCGKPDLSDKGIVFPVFFGMPTAIEDKEMAAILFADAIIKEEKKRGEEVCVHIGISTSVAYAGEFGANTRKDFTIVGNAINFAARLMMNASNHGQYAVFLDRTTKRRVTSMCNVESQPGIVFKGFTTKQTVYQFKSLKKTVIEEERKTPLIGRTEELAHLFASYVVSRRGKLKIVPITGEVGSGKSFLAETLVTDVLMMHSKTPILHGTASRFENATPFYLWRDIIKQVVALEDSMTEDEVMAKASAVFEKCFPEEKEWLPFFLDSLGYNFEDELSSEVDSVTRLSKLYELSHKLLIAYAKKHPIIIMLENVQYADASSFDMIEYLLMEESNVPILLLVISRDELQLKRLCDAYELPLIHLKKLSESDSLTLVKLLLNFKIPDEVLAQKIISIADYNPLFIEHIVESLIDNEKIIPDEQGYYYAPQHIEKIEIPLSIQNLILAQLNTLPFDKQVICKNASVIGYDFTFDELAILTEENASESEIKEALDELVLNKLLVCNDKNKTQYSFKNNITKDVIYRSIVGQTKRRLNRTMMEYIENNNKDSLSSVAELLLHYAREAREDENIIRYADLIRKMRTK